MTAIAAFQTIATSCLRHFRLNEDAHLVKAQARSPAGSGGPAASALGVLPLQVDRSGDEPVRLNGELRWLVPVLGEARTDHLANSGLLASALPRAQNFAARVLEKKRKRLKKDGKALRRLTATIGTKFRKDTNSGMRRSSPARSSLTRAEHAGTRNF